MTCQESHSLCVTWLEFKLSFPKALLSLDFIYAMNYATLRKKKRLTNSVGYKANPYQERRSREIIDPTTQSTLLN
jgi:hypothetical protein